MWRQIGAFRRPRRLASRGVGAPSRLLSLSTAALVPGAVPAVTSTVDTPPDELSPAGVSVVSIASTGALLVVVGIILCLAARRRPPRHRAPAPNQIWLHLSSLHRTAHHHVLRLRTVRRQRVNNAPRHRR
ncbi:hypothetical protein [Phytohabitans suffuscus]|uniref:Uncharacterized protein n=1 Tax=Phytohabitans suffuscus TaxID=624315 RepID=A0A6F8YCR5_9ACTN|nr:hypothetical protein [Phytohabitans suffuscus]BCB83823.1 hypothetical protein Psuf_011360 [Phytohabitans suffuscus]